MAQESVRLNVPMLNGGNYIFWKTKLRAIFVRDDLWNIVSVSKPEKADGDWQKKNNKAMAYITLSVEDSQLIHFAHLNDAFDAWQVLSKKYERSTFGSRLYLRRKLYGIKYRSGPMNSHIDSIMELVGLLRGSGRPLENDEIVAVLLVSLPEAYSGLVTALEGRDEADLTVEYVTGKMIDEYQRRVEAGESGNGNSEMALQSAVAGSSKVSRGHQKGSNNGTKGGKTNKDDKELRVCYFCHKPGHLKADCYRFKRSQQQRSAGTESAKSSVEVNVSNRESYITFKARDQPRTVSTRGWCIDSGATSHMTNDREFFSSLRDTSATIYLADGSSVAAAGVGEGQFYCESSDGRIQEVRLKNVLYIPQLDDGLLSVNRITEQGHRVTFENDTCSIYRNHQVIAEARSDGNLFRLQTVAPGSTAYSARETVCLHQWHRRLGHRDPAAIKRLINEELSTGIRVSTCSEEVVCESCIKGKLTQTKFTASKLREKEPMRLIHSDLCGPMQTATPSGNRYFLTLIDDHSRFAVVRLIKSKDEVAGVVQEYIAEMSTRFGRKPIAIRTDNGKEYVSRELENFLRKEGIQHQLTVPYTPQQNGVAERKNRSLTESAKCMLLDAGLNNRFWGEAILTAAYLQNRLPSRSINKTPVELFTGVKPNLDHIRVFGSKVYSLVPKQKRKKWDDKAEEGVLIGYDGSTKGYRILDPKTAKVWISRSVRIIESGAKHRVLVDSTPEEGVTKIIPHAAAQMEGVSIEMGLVDNKIQNPRGKDMVTEEEYESAPETSQVPQRRVSERRNKNVPPTKLTYKVLTEHATEPRTWDEMLRMTPRERKLWSAAAEEEMHCLNQHRVWELTELPPGKKTISCKWVFKAKLDGDGQIHAYKARLVARGFSQRYGEDYDETYAPVVKHETIRVLLVVAAQRGLHVRHLDVRSAYLNGELNEEIYMEQPQGFEEPGQEDKVLKLRKSLYGLKQSARVWNKRATEVFSELGFQQGIADQCLYSRKEEDGSITYVLLYVDDLLVAGQSAESTEKVSRELQNYFDIKDLGDVSHYLGIQVERQANGSFLLNQKAKITKLLEDHGLLESKPVATPMETGFLSAGTTESAELPNNTLYRKAIGSLLYIATVSRLDIAVAVSILSRRVEKPTQQDWNAVKRVMRYLAFTINKKLCLPSSESIELNCYVDADWAGEKIDRKSTSGYVFLLGKGAVAWSSRKQTSVAMSSTEAEYVAASFASRELLWLRQLLMDMNVPVVGPTTVYEDNQGCIRLIESNRSGAQTKHIDVCHHQLRDLREKGIIDVLYCPSNKMLGDLFTKPLAREPFQNILEQLGFQ